MKPELWKARLHKKATFGQACLHNVHCANPGAVIGAMDFNDAWKNSDNQVGKLAQK
jgi:hypothetical protein